MAVQMSSFQGLGEWSPRRDQIGFPVQMLPVDHRYQFPACEAEHDQLMSYARSRICGQQSTVTALKFSKSIGQNHAMVSTDLQATVRPERLALLSNQLVAVIVRHLTACMTVSQPATLCQS